MIQPNDTDNCLLAALRLIIAAVALVLLLTGALARTTRGRRCPWCKCEIPDTGLCPYCRDK